MRSITRRKPALFCGFHAAVRRLTVSAKFKAALHCFREIHRHPLVPLKLVVPIDEKWPVECHGMELGAKAASYRAKYRRGTMDTTDELVLSELGFAFDNNDWKWEHKVQSAFVTYKEEHGDLNVPVAFVIPSSATWAEELWGMKFGMIVNNIRAKGYYLSDDKPERKEWLDEMGFVWDDLERRWDIAQTALTMYKEEHGDLNVPHAFVVPSSAPWAEETWGMKLGSIVNTIRSYGQYLSDDKPERKEWLDEMGFVWDEHERRWDIAQTALTMYKEEHGDLNVPHAFVVPSSAPWAEETWGMKLGSIVRDIRSQGHYLSDDKPERKEWLDEMGFVWDDLERRWEVAQTVLTVYKEEHGDLNVPKAFVIPSSAPWAEETWGMALGSAVDKIRSRGDYLRDDKPERKEWLDEMGFRWRTPSPAE
jgi:hypothetical protein